MSTSTNFGRWFHQATGNPPYPYQERIAQAPRLPELLDAPTGAGKTAAAVLGWLWHRRMHPDAAVRAATPRRLVYILPMRVLVEQTVRVIEEWIEHLGETLGDDPPAVALLMGGHVDRDWETEVEGDLILVGTQDQILSRALNRGYAMSRFQWPAHFALVHNDAQWVLDEVQLMGVGLTTSAQLTGLREALGVYGPARTLWMSATLRRDWLETPDLPRPRVAALSAESLTDADRKGKLGERIDASKPVSKAPTGADPKKLAQWLSEQHRPGTLTLVVLNQVRRAQEVHKRLRTVLSKEADLLLLHSRFRAADRRRVEAALRGEVPAGGRVVVATQTVEAGVDLSAATLVTDLAPWPSLVQRFGRCNRYGEQTAAAVHWIDLDTKKSAAPYTADQLDRARDLLAKLTDARIRTLPPVDEAPALHHVLRRKDLLDLFDTDADLDGNHLDVSRYIRDGEDTDVHLFWRDLGKGGPDDSEREPEADELCPVSLSRFRDLIKRAKQAGPNRIWQWDTLDGRWARIHQDAGGAAPGFVAPGLTYLVESNVGGYTVEAGFDPADKAPVPPVPAPAESSPDAAGRDPLSERPFVLLSKHLQDVAAEVSSILGHLGDLALPTDIRAAVQSAALWHDVGKAHPVFQNAAKGEQPPEGLLAKAPAFERYAHRGFRHELASGLAALQSGQPDLVAYLAAAHHGKVRLRIRPLAGEQPPPDGRAFARGIYDGDTLPPVALGSLKTPELTLDLSVARMGRSAHGPSWTERAEALVDALGPFRLALLETLLRAADRRASAAEEAEVNHG